MVTMRPGMDRGKQSPDRKGTSRVSKPQAGKPATARMSMQGQRGGGEQPQRQGQGPAPEQNKSMLYVGIGGGALVFVVILALMLSGGEEGAKGGGSYEGTMKTAI